MVKLVSLIEFVRYAFSKFIILTTLYLLKVIILKMWT